MLGKSITKWENFSYDIFCHLGLYQIKVIVYVHVSTYAHVTISEYIQLCISQFVQTFSINYVTPKTEKKKLTLHQSWKQNKRDACMSICVYV